MKISRNNRFGFLAALTTATSILSLGIALPAKAVGETRTYYFPTPAVASCVQGTTSAPGASSIVTTPTGPYSGTTQVNTMFGNFVTSYAGSANGYATFTVVQNALPVSFLWSGLDSTVASCGGSVVG
ncbi:MAG: hypothetical protein WA919_17530 [Coleofasciculaceae cyanobacterium]